MHRMKLLWSLHTIINTVQASVSAIVSGLWGPDYNVKGVFLLFLLIRSMEFIWKQCSQSTMCCFSQVTLGGGHILGSLQQCKLRLPRWPGVVEGHDGRCVNQTMTLARTDERETSWSAPVMSYRFSSVQNTLLSFGTE